MLEDTTYCCKKLAKVNKEGEVSVCNTGHSIGWIF